jgi:hypothetical protein
MFCDLVDSTGIAAKLDAEEWRDLVGAYLDAASAAVTDLGGKVAKKLGDGLMALFGYPVAQENDAERAVRAALAIQRSLVELNRRKVRWYCSPARPGSANRGLRLSDPAMNDEQGTISSTRLPSIPSGFPAPTSCSPMSPPAARASAWLPQLVAKFTKSAAITHYLLT